jgi:hypothetical protein
MGEGIRRARQEQQQKADDNIPAKAIRSTKFGFHGPLPFGLNPTFLSPGTTGVPKNPPGVHDGAIWTHQTFSAAVLKIAEEKVHTLPVESAGVVRRAG